MACLSPKSLSIKTDVNPIISLVAPIQACVSEVLARLEEEREKAGDTSQIGRASCRERV